MTKDGTGTTPKKGNTISKLIGLLSKNNCTNTKLADNSSNSMFYSTFSADSSHVSGNSDRYSHHNQMSENSLSSLQNCSNYHQASNNPNQNKSDAKKQPAQSPTTKKNLKRNLSSVRYSDALKSQSDMAPQAKQTTPDQMPHVQLAFANLTSYQDDSSIIRYNIPYLINTLTSTDLNMHHTYSIDQMRSAATSLYTIASRTPANFNLETINKLCDSIRLIKDHNIWHAVTATFYCLTNYMPCCELISKSKFIDYSV